MKKLQDLYIRYRHGIPAVIYMIFYMAWFCALEQTVTKHYHVIYTPLDDLIPFCEVFIIPYLLWFAYVAAIILYLFFTNKHDFIKNCIFLFVGMTIFLIISTVWPNGHHLRPYRMPRDNFLTDLVVQLYSTDTSTNIFPSIHVYNSIGVHLAVVNCDKLKNHKFIRLSSLILCVSIILSTVFLKQHSVHDVIGAFILSVTMYLVVYHKEFSLVERYAQRRKKRSAPQVGYLK